MGRVVLGHLSATLADLAQRGFLRIEEIPRSDDPDWLLTDLRDTRPGQGGLLRFEATLLDGLLSHRQVRLSALGQDLIPVLGKVRVQLRQDAVRARRLRRFRREQRTARGERLLEEIHGFRRGLRALAASGGPGALARMRWSSGRPCLPPSAWPRTLPGDLSASSRCPMAEFRPRLATDL